MWNGESVAENGEWGMGNGESADASRKRLRVDDWARSPATPRLEVFIPHSPFPIPHSPFHIHSPFPMSHFTFIPHSPFPISFRHHAARSADCRRSADDWIVVPGFADPHRQVPIGGSGQVRSRFNGWPGGVSHAGR